jgi:hypothetical protein
MTRGGDVPLLRRPNVHNGVATDEPTAYGEAQA